MMCFSTRRYQIFLDEHAPNVHLVNLPLRTLRAILEAFYGRSAMKWLLRWWGKLARVLPNCMCSACSCQEIQRKYQFLPSTDTESIQVCKGWAVCAIVSLIPPQACCAITRSSESESLGNNNPYQSLERRHNIAEMKHCARTINTC